MGQARYPEVGGEHTKEDPPPPRVERLSLGP